nr:PIN domain-containing protein [Nostoc sp. ChiQUE02]MDZ8232609.1 PIN domain-containing protein [Nostoc sp. ChiQUE02]
MTYLLDTCVISELVAKQPNQQVLDWLDAQMPETLYLSVITIGEIAKGISKLTASKRKDSLLTWLNETLPNRFERRILSVDASKSNFVALACTFDALTYTFIALKLQKSALLSLHGVEVLA